MGEDAGLLADMPTAIRSEMKRMVLSSLSGCATLSEVGLF